MSLERKQGKGVGPGSLSTQGQGDTGSAQDTLPPQPNETSVFTPSFHSTQALIRMALLLIKSIWWQQVQLSSCAGLCCLLAASRKGIW